MDILLDQDGDLLLTPQGDMVFAESVSQKILIRLRWFAEEWRWNREEGLPYRDRLLRKNPDVNFMEAAIRTKIFDVPEVTEVRDVRVTVDPKTRSASVQFEAYTDQETIREEVRLYAGLRGH